MVASAPDNYLRRRLLIAFAQLVAHGAYCSYEDCNGSLWPFVDELGAFVGVSTIAYCGSHWISHLAAFDCYYDYDDHYDSELAALPVGDATVNL